MGRMDYRVRNYTSIRGCEGRNSMLPRRAVNIFSFGGFMRSARFVVATFILATAMGSYAQCPENPDGGPTLIHFRGGNDGSLTDVDLGTTGVMHDIEAPGLRMTACLANCDASTNPNCTIESVRTNAQGQVGITTPTPLFVAGNHVCVNLKFPTPFPATTGTANIQTGDISFATSVDATVYVGSVGAACPTCVAGFCNGGGANGRPCAVERSVTVDGTLYDLSFECQPSGTSVVAFNFPVELTTAATSQSTCPDQASGDACATASAGTCDQTTCTAPTDGLRQNCCSGDLARSCFPEAGVTRTGLAAAPLPLWPSPTYPKTEKGTLVSATCAPSADPTADATLGLPGPAAIDWHVITDWEAVDTTTTTSTSSTTLPTLPGNCTPPDCNDDNACTLDGCVDQVCTHDLQAGIPGVRCLIDRMRTHPLCGETTVDAKLAAVIDAALGKADGALAKADAATGKKRAKQLKKVKKQLSRIFRKTDKAKAKGKIPDECHTAISGRTGSINAAFGAIQ